MLTPGLPGWLPPAVGRAVAVIRDDGPPLNKELVLRLAADKRMEAVWREVGKRRRTWQGRTISNKPITWEEALGVFFLQAFHFAALPVPAITTAKLDGLCKAYERGAAQLRTLAKEMAQLNQSLPLSLLLQHECPTLWEDVDHGANIIKAAGQLQSIAAALANIHSPHIVARDFGKADERGYVRSLAEIARRLFGSPLYGTIATVANVALQPKSPITPKQVINWCSTNKGGQ